MMSRACSMLLLGAVLGSGCLGFHQGPMPGEPQGATYLDVEGTRVRIRDEGSGPAVVFLHGFASSLETWDGLWPALVGKHRLLSLDLKGFGWTDRPEGDYSPAAHAAMLKALLDARGIERATLVAHSFGCSVALAFALAYPERVDKLALYSAWVYEEQLPAFFHLARLPGVGDALVRLFYNERPDERLTQAFYNPDIVSEGLVEAVERALERPGTRAAALAAIRAMRYAEVEGRYRTIRAPTLLLWGREDRVSRLDIGERLVSELPNARLEVYPRCGHLPMLEAAASTRDLVNFVESGT